VKFFLYENWCTVAEVIVKILVTHFFETRCIYSAAFRCRWWWGYFRWKVNFVTK